jgi:penicillin-binding protein 1A
MGLFGLGSGRKSRRRARTEPRLFANSRRGSDRRNEERPRRRRRSIIVRLFTLAAALSIWGMVILGAGFSYIWFSLDQKGLLNIPQREPGVMLLAADGSVLSEQGAFFGDEVRIAELPSYVPNAIIAIEDRRFRWHHGVDPIGLTRAMVENLKAGRVVQGGSTLTQQLAKNLFLSPEKTFERKAQEMVLAIWLESRFSKDEILQLYVNRVYFGSGATGIEKAAQRYFGKSARDVNLSEAAILAAVLKAPATYNPLLHPKEGAARAREVIDSMTAEGFLSETEAQDAIATPLAVKASDYVPATQYIADWVIEQLPGLVQKYDRSIIVETTIEPDLQARAETALRKRLNEEGGKLHVTQGAFVLMDTAGAVKALVGGKSYQKSQFNRATKAKRQPGSSFKPFVYLTAVEQGYSPGSVEVDEPIKIGDWEPENYKRKYLGTVTLKKALALSLNTVAAKLAYNVGPQNVVNTAHRLGITSELAPNASIALGTSEVTLLEMTSAFVPFANGGAPAPPFVIKRITTRDGEVLYERQGQALAPIVSSFDLGAMNDMMRAVLIEGTGRRAKFGKFDLAGKTGTSQEYRDAWFIGYSSYMVAGVWAGNDDNTPTEKVTGGSIPAAIWRDVMEPAHQGLKPLPLPGDEDYQYNGDPAVADYESDPARRRKAAEQYADDGSQGDGFFDLFFSKKEKRKQRATTTVDPPNRRNSAFEQTRGNQPVHKPN